MKILPDPGRSNKIFGGLALLALLGIGASLSIPTISIGMASSWGTPGLGLEALEQTEVLCSGHFSPGWFPFPWTEKVTLNSDPVESSIARSTPARRRMVQFVVDQYWKGRGPKKIEVALFEPTSGTLDGEWKIPEQKNLLLALKKDTTGSGGFQLVNQTNCWLVVENSAEAASVVENPRERIEALARDELVALAADLKTQGQSVDGRDYKRLKQAAGTLGKFRSGGPAVTGALQSYISNPTSPFQREAFITLTKVSPLGAWTLGRQLYQAGVLEARCLGLVFDGILTPQNFLKIDPAELAELFDRDPQLARDMAQAFRKMNDPGAIPWLARCLDYPDVEVQYLGMSGLYKIFGEREKISTPLMTKFEEDPETFLKPYKNWWLAHRAEYAQASSP